MWRGLSDNSPLPRTHWGPFQDPPPVASRLPPGPTSYRSRHLSFTVLGTKLPAHEALGTHSALPPALQRGRSFRMESEGRALQSRQGASPAQASGPPASHGKLPRPGGGHAGWGLASAELRQSP